MNKNRTYEATLKIAKKIARTKYGSLFVIGPASKFKGTYELLYPNLSVKGNLNKADTLAVIEKLATLDGAVLISDKGKIIAYGAKLKESKTLPGFGTKHAAAAGTTSHIKGSTAILVSEEINWIKVFQDGKIILEMDSQENPKLIEHDIITFITEGDTALLTAAGLSAALIGPTIITPIMIIGGAYLAIKTAGGIIKKSLKVK